MPLVSDGKSKPLAHSNLRSIRFWMSVQGRGLVQPVRVVISTRPCRSSTRRTFGIYMAPWKPVQIANRDCGKPECRPSD